MDEFEIEDMLTEEAIEAEREGRLGAPVTWRRVQGCTGCAEFLVCPRHGRVAA
jgi:hypothetical protein